ncbi:MAG: DUF932 domain-containing protein [Myxococcales bacterium]|nr:DUF932 domain-containing protein [Myxococcales bacterium]
MSHELESMFFVGRTPWHGLGTALDCPPSIDAALEVAGLDWNVECRPLYLQSGVEVAAQAVVRDFDESVLGVVGPRYHPLQNKDAFAFFQPLVEDKLVDLETAGSLSEGKKVWVLARIVGDPLVVQGDDVVERFILLSNSHDGSLAVRVGFTPIRVVCSNTLAYAHETGASRLIRILHTAGAKDTLDGVREIMSLADRSFTATAEQFRYLASKPIVAADLQKYVERVFAVPEAADPSKQSCPRVLGQVIPLFENGKGSEMASAKGTWWGAYNAISEHLTHYRGRSADSRVNSLWFGDSAKLNRSALSTACMMAAL